jgi:hypothetical protein
MQPRVYQQLTSIEAIYIDVARLDAERRVDKVKEETNSWLEQAKGKVPCLLVLDGLDSLVGPENEVSFVPQFFPSAGRSKLTI